jgi:hypothetical protein
VGAAGTVEEGHVPALEVAAQDRELSPASTQGIDGKGHGILQGEPQV